jgi:hypothetical protein
MKIQGTYMPGWFPKTSAIHVLIFSHGLLRVHRNFNLIHYLQEQPFWLKNMPSSAERRKALNAFRRDVLEAAEDLAKRSLGFTGAAVLREAVADRIMAIVGASWHELSDTVQKRYIRGWKVKPFDRQIELVFPAWLRCKCGSRSCPGCAGALAVDVDQAAADVLAPLETVGPEVVPLEDAVLVPQDDPPVGVAMVSETPPAPAPVAATPPQVLPTFKLRESGWRSYCCENRARLVAKCREAHGDTLNGEKLKVHVRSLAKQEFKGLPANDQWRHAAQSSMGQATERGPRGRFVPFGQACADQCNFGDDLSHKYCLNCGRLQPNVEIQQEKPRAAFPDLKTTRGQPNRQAKRRVQQLRGALNHAAGLSSPVNVAAVLAVTLTPQEMVALAETKQFNATQNEEHRRRVAWARIGRKLVELLQRYFHHIFSLMVLVAMAVRMCGYSRVFVYRCLDLSVPIRSWRHSRTCTAPGPLKQKHNNGRFGKRLISAAAKRAIALKHSQETSSIIRGTKRKSEGENPIPKIRRATTSSVSQMWRQESCLNSCCSLRTFQRWFKDDEEFADCLRTKRRVDLCAKCTSFDKVVRPLMRRSFGRWRKLLENAWPGYWVEWDASAQFTIHQKDNMEPAVIEALWLYIDNARLHRPEPGEPGMLKKLSDIRDVELPILVEFERNWSCIDMQMGLLECMNAFGLHFTIKDQHKSAYRYDFDNPQEGVGCIHLDFLEHSHVPKGPEESGGFFYHGGYTSFTILIFTVWTLGRFEYHTYVSHVQDQTAMYALACYRDLLLRLARDWGPSVTAWRTIKTYMDCGPHYRAGLFMGYLFDLVVQRPSLEESIVILFADGHGKGPCDGEGGRVKEHYERAAKRVMIKSLPVLCREVGHETELVRKHNPSTPQCFFHHFHPPLPCELPQVRLDTAALRKLKAGLKTHYYWTARKQRSAGGHVYSGVDLEVAPYLGAQSKRFAAPYMPGGKKVKPGEAEASEDEDDIPIGKWRMYYRTREPEKFVPELATLRQKWQAANNKPAELHGRRQNVDTRVALWRRRRARRNKQNQAANAHQKAQRKALPKAAEAAPAAAAPAAAPAAALPAAVPAAAPVAAAPS